MRFVKYHALGNSYLVLEDAEALRGSELSAVVRRLCDPHRGVGGDGTLRLLGLEGSSFRFEVRNPDGSLAEVSGNGARIFARYLVDSGRVGEGSFELLSSAGVAVRAEVRSGEPIRVELAAPSLQPTPPEFYASLAPWRPQVVSVGNPHLVLYGGEGQPELEVAALTPLAQQLESHSRFPARTNVQFAVARSLDTVEALVYERGAGWTAASGSSAMAIVAAGRALGLLGNRVAVHMPGGMLEVEVRSLERWRLSGPVVRVAAGMAEVQV